MHPPEQVEHVARLVAQGENDQEIARLTGVARSTVRDWRRTGRRGQPRCPRCSTARSLPAPEYAYLLGLYLGDGYIARSARVWQLRIYLDTRYPEINAAALAAMGAVRGGRVAVVPRVGCVAVSSYWKHWPCVLPQHGAGKKHERRIALEPWQQTIVDAHPTALLRGLVHSDGWRADNVVRVRGRRYAYPRYGFKNLSPDIRRIFCDACDLLGVEWRVMNQNTISVARRDSVAKLDAFIGPKR